MGSVGCKCKCNSVSVILWLTEFLKWIAIMAGLYLCVWQYCVILQTIPIFVPGWDNLEAQFWTIFTTIMIGASVVIYFPWRVISIKMRSKYNCVRDERIRPAIAVYILLCAVPSFTLILYAFEVSRVTNQDMSPASITALQIVVMGLVLTEWMVKIQQEKFTFNLITAMALDFFLAYDIIALIMMSGATNVANTGWIYPCFIFGVIAMFKYLPTQPIAFNDRQKSTGHVVCIVTSMICNDIPFVVIRLATMISFGFLISDMVFLVKNIFVIIFNIIQLSVIFYNRNRGFDSVDGIPENRCFRGDDEIWGKIGEMIKANKIGEVANNRNDYIEPISDSVNTNQAFVIEEL